MYRLRRLVIGYVLWVATVAVAQRRHYSQDRMPDTSFSCRDKIIGGYYADPETDCQMFHVCVKVPGLGIQDYKFLCPNETSFDQENQICDDWYNIDCEASTLFYSDNFDLYRIGGDIPRSNLEPRLPSNNINNAVSEVDDEYYLQKSDRGENVGSDLLRGSHSSNFFSNKNRGREDDDYNKDELKKGRNNNVKKLLTGKRLIHTTQVPLEDNKASQQPQYRPKANNIAARNSQFHRNQQQSTEAPAKITETFNNRQKFTQRNYYSPTTPKIETTSSTEKVDYYRNYNPTTKHSYYDNSQNYNSQTAQFTQSTQNYQNFRTTTTQYPTTVNYYETTLNYEKNNNYETQKLFKLNTGAINQYDDSKDEFLKTAPSLNLGASAFNSLQNSYKNLNTSVSGGYNFIPAASTTDNHQQQTYFNPTTQTQNYYTSSTVKPYQQDYTTPKPTITEVYKQNFYNPQIQQSSTIKNDYQYSQTTQKPQQQYSYSTELTNAQYNPTTLNQFQYNQNNNQKKYTTIKPVQYNNQPIPQFNKQAVPQYNNQPVQQYNQPIQQTYQNPSKEPVTYQPQRTLPGQQSFQPQKNIPVQQPYQQTHVSQKAKQYQAQQNPTTFQQPPKNYYNLTTQKPQQSIKTTSNPRGTKPTTLDATERPRPFTQETVKSNKEQKKEKDQYDYAYYDDGTQSEYDNLEPVEEFSRTKSKN